MPTETKSPTYVAQENAAAKAGSMIADATLISGKSQTLQLEVDIPAGTGAADTILAGYLPSGVTVVPGQSSITTTVVCGAGTFKIGTASDDDAIRGLGASNSVGTSILNSAVPSFKSTSRQAVIITLNGALTSGGKFFLNLGLVYS